MAKDVTYQAEVLRGYARGLYASARWLEVLYAAAGAALLGGPLYSTLMLAALIHSLLNRGFGGLFSQAAPPPPSLEPGQVLLIVLTTAAGGLGGYLSARTKALALRVQAQSALCQVEIEQNTRRR